MPSGMQRLREQAQTGYQLGAQEGLSGISKAANLANGAFTVLFVLIIVAVSALVGGEFISAVPTDGPFSSSITDLENNAGTAFTLFAVGLLIIPAAAIIGFLASRMGGLMGGMGGMGR